MFGAENNTETFIHKDLVTSSQSNTFTVNQSTTQNLQTWDQTVPAHSDQRTDAANTTAWSRPYDERYTKGPQQSRFAYQEDNNIDTRGDIPGAGSVSGQLDSVAERHKKVLFQLNKVTQLHEENSAVYERMLEDNTKKLHNLEQQAHTMSDDDFTTQHIFHVDLHEKIAKHSHETNEELYVSREELRKMQVIDDPSKSNFAGLKSEEVSRLEASYDNSDSKYGRDQHITFSYGPAFDPRVHGDAYLHSDYRRQKGIESALTNIDLEAYFQSDSLDPELSERLGNIPVDDQINNDSERKHSKITIHSHGYPGGFAITESVENEEVEVNAAEIGKMLAAHLQKGNYKDLLTIVLMCCYGALDGENDLSSLQQIANVLSDAGIEGVKLTGSEVPTYISYSHNFGSPVGSSGTLNNDDESPDVKYSESEYKRDIWI